MTPPCHTFPASSLPTQVQLDVQGRRRKLDSPARKIDLPACELLQMLQYKCEVQRPLTRDGPVTCFAVDRLFRRCKDKKGSFMVETTAWEGAADEAAAVAAASAAAASGAADGTAPKRPYQWSSNWQDPDAPS